MSKPKFIIVEGADGAGKTTFCKTLCAEIEDQISIQAEYVTFGTDSLTTHSMREFQSIIDTMKFWVPGYYVIDRFLLTDFLYNLYLKEYTSGAVEGLSMWSKFIERYQTLTVVIDRAMMKEDFSDPKINIPRDTFNHIIQGYRDFSSTFNHRNVLIRCISQGGLKDTGALTFYEADTHCLLEDILKYIERQKEEGNA